MSTISINDLIEVIIKEYALKIRKNPQSISLNAIGSSTREKVSE